MTDSEITYSSNAADIIDGMQQAAVAAVTTMTDRIKAKAQENCPVGTITRAGESWRERVPGLLKSTIMSRVRVMDDGTGDVVGWVKAGTEGAADKVSGFYAPFVEFGHKTTTGKHIEPNPFMRNAFRDVTADDLNEEVALEFTSVRRKGVRGNR